MFLGVFLNRLCKTNQTFVAARNVAQTLKRCAKLIKAVFKEFNSLYVFTRLYYAL